MGILGLSLTPCLGCQPRASPAYLPPQKWLHFRGENKDVSLVRPAQSRWGSDLDISPTSMATIPTPHTPTLENFRDERMESSDSSAAFSSACHLLILLIYSCKSSAYL